MDQFLINDQYSTRKVRSKFSVNGAIELLRLERGYVKDCKRIQPSCEVLGSTLGSRSHQSKIVGPDTCDVAFICLLIRTVRADFKYFSIKQKAGRVGKSRKLFLCATLKVSGGAGGR